MFKRAFESIGNAYDYTKEKVHNVIDNATGKVAAVGTGLAMTTGQAFAAVPASVTTALSDAQTDGVTIATAVFVAIVAMYAFKLMRKGL